MLFLDLSLANGSAAKLPSAITQHSMHPQSDSLAIWASTQQLLLYSKPFTIFHAPHERPTLLQQKIEKQQQQQKKNKNLNHSAWSQKQMLQLLYQVVICSNSVKNSCIIQYFNILTRGGDFILQLQHKMNFYVLTLILTPLNDGFPHINSQSQSRQKKTPLRIRKKELLIIFCFNV